MLCMPQNIARGATIPSHLFDQDVAIRALFTQWKAKYKLNYKPAVVRHVAPTYLPEARIAAPMPPVANGPKLLPVPVCF